MKRFTNRLIDIFKKGDMILLGLCVAASLFGIVMIYAATQWQGSSRYIAVQSGALLAGKIPLELRIAVHPVGIQPLGGADKIPKASFPAGYAVRRYRTEVFRRGTAEIVQIQQTVVIVTVEHLSELP